MRTPFPARHANAAAARIGGGSRRGWRGGPPAADDVVRCRRGPAPPSPAGQRAEVETGLTAVPVGLAAVCTTGFAVVVLAQQSLMITGVLITAQPFE